ncbi:hypothetical protein F5Y16DRAFT_61976 [Xylariaceae sp. FL0255]|nr:hypothetical protein F5Y16DRAFT_61976 [Xylariaceae sp. FL0255]
MSISSEKNLSESQDEWVRVWRRKGHGAKSRTQLRSGSTQPASASSTPTPSPPSLTLEQVKKDHERFAGQWKSSSACVRLQQILSSNEPGVQVEKAICFGLGTFDPPDGSWDVKRKAHVQVAAFLAIVEHVGLQSDKPISCFFQDPILNAVDREFIESLGHQVVESPGGFELVDTSTLAFGVHLYRDIYSQVIAAHTPAMFVGTPYDVWEDFHGTEKLNWGRMKELDQQSSKSKFPENDFETAFSSTSIHWARKEET